MANYQLQVENLRYDPTAWLTEVDKNLERAKQEHRAAEVAYGEMQSKADMFEKLANDVQGKDSQAYQNYINFAKTLRQHTDLLATQGVNPALWRNLMQAKSDYSRIIHPIEEAWNARDREAQRQAKYLEAHPHAIFEKDARDMGIDQWLKNPHYVAKSIDREVVANRAMERYKALQKQVMEMVSQSGMTPDAISRMTPTQVHAYVKQNAPYLYEAIEKRGVSPEEVQRFMAGDTTAIGSILTNVMDETLGMYGLSNWNTDYDHFTLDQNRRRRDNINDMLKSTIVGESSNAVGDSEFKQYKDDISGDLAYKYAALAEQKRHNEALEADADAKRAAAGIRDPNKLDTYYYHENAFNLDPTRKTTEVANLQGVMNLIDLDNEFALYDYKDIADAAQKALGKDWKTLLGMPGAVQGVLNTLKKSYSYSTAGTYEGDSWMSPSDPARSSRFARVVDNAIKNSGINIGDKNRNKAAEIIKLIKNIPKNDDGTVSYGSINLGNYTDADLLAAAKLAMYDGDKLKYLDAEGKYDAPEEDVKPVNALGLEIIKRIKNGTWDNGVSPTERKLRNLIDYDPNKLFSLNAQADQYIGNSAISLKGFTSNYALGSDDVHTTQILRRAQNRQAQDNGAGNDRLSGIYDEDGNYLDVNKPADLQKLIGTDDIDNPKHLLNASQMPVINKNGNIEFKQYFVGKDGRRYFFDDDLISDGTSKRKSHKDALTNTANKIYHYSAKDMTNKHGESLTLADVRNELRASYPNFDEMTDKQKQYLIDSYLYARMQYDLKDDFKAYEENGGNWFLNWFNNTHNVNSMKDMDNANTDVNLYNFNLYN